MSNVPPPLKTRTKTFTFNVPAETVGQLKAVPLTSGVLNSASLTNNSVESPGAPMSLIVRDIETRFVLYQIDDFLVHGQRVTESGMKLAISDKMEALMACNNHSDQAIQAIGILQMEFN